MINGGDSKRWNEEPLYRFFTNEIYKTERQIEENSRKLKTLTSEQVALKRGRTELVRLRRELDKKK